MDITKWKSMAISKKEHEILLALSKSKFRGPAAMFSKIFNDYLDFQAKKAKLTKAEYIKKVLTPEK